jgi:hypothetical protein
LGEPATTIKAYFESDATPEYVDRQTRQAGEQLRIRALRVEQDGSVRDWCDYAKPCEIRLVYEIYEPLNNLLLGFDLYTSNGVPVMRSYDLAGYGMGIREPGLYHSVCRLPGGLLQPGVYYVQLLAGVHRFPWISKEKITVDLKLVGGRETDVDYPGILLPQGEWEVARLNGGTE